MNDGFFVLRRYGSGQRPLLPYEPHLGMDMTSSGESSSGFTSQDSTMERCKTGIRRGSTPVWAEVGPQMCHKCFVLFVHWGG